MLTPEATYKKNLLVRQEGAWQVRREIGSYNLDVVISVSYPGSDRSVRLEQLRAGRARPRRYRNRRIGEFLKELEFTEGRSTGIPKIMEAMEKNGSPPAEFEFDEDHSYFMVRLPIHPAALEVAGSRAGGDSAHSRSESGVESELANRIFELLQGGVFSKLEIAQKLGKFKPTRYLNDLVGKMLEVGLIEYTIADKPNSRLQQYRLTNKCQNLIASRKGGKP